MQVSLWIMNDSVITKRFCSPAATECTSDVWFQPRWLPPSSCSTSCQTVWFVWHPSCRQKVSSWIMSTFFYCILFCPSVSLNNCVCLFVCSSIQFVFWHCLKYAGSFTVNDSSNSNGCYDNMYELFRWAVFSLQMCFRDFGPSQWVSGSHRLCITNHSSNNEDIRLMPRPTPYSYGYFVFSGVPVRETIFYIHSHCS